jgi:hypothetical protein
MLLTILLGITLYKLGARSLILLPFNHLSFQNFVFLLFLQCFCLYGLQLQQSKQSALIQSEQIVEQICSTILSHFFFVFVCVWNKVFYFSYLWCIRVIINSSCWVIDKQLNLSNVFYMSFRWAIIGQDAKTL